MYAEPTMTAEHVKALRRPFHHNAVKWLPVGGLTKRGSQAFMPHIDASLVIERLSEVDPCWSEVSRPMINNTEKDGADPFGIKHMLPWECTLTVHGVTRTGRGQLGPTGPRNNQKPPQVDDKHIKSAESDALKRAALRFGVGAYLRAIPMIYLDKQTNGGEAFSTRGEGKDEKFGFLSKIGKRVLRDSYMEVVQHQAFIDHYGAMVDYGDVDDDQDDVEVPDVPASEAPPADPAELGVLVLMSKFTGREQSEDYVRGVAETKPFGKSLAQALTTIKANLGVSAQDTEQLRELAQKAGAGDAKALAALEDGLNQLSDLANAETGDDSEQEVMDV